MAEYDNTNRGAIWKNDKKQSKWSNVLHRSIGHFRIISPIYQCAR